MWDWSLTSGPAQEPIDVQDAKDHARISHAREDGLILADITAARQAFEHSTNRAAMTQTWTLQLRGFATVMPLPMAAPLQNDATADPSTVPVVRYYDVDGVLQTLDSSYYVVNTVSEPGQIERAPEQTWPSVQCDRRYPVVITYVAGWTSQSLVPELVKQGLRIYVAGLDEMRNGVSFEASRRAAESLWSAYQVFVRDPEFY